MYGNLAALDRRIELLLSVPLLLEYEAVLSRPEHLAATGLNSEDLERVLDDLAGIARAVKFAYRWRPRLPDPNDGMVLETAVNGNADAIVTFNQKDFRDATGAFALPFCFRRMHSNKFGGCPDEEKQFRIAAATVAAGAESVD